ncbi:TadE/TadG family type IV pilus assembly protein [Ammonifex thiophilus]|uniref:TadE-like domain-containing protein n=1 Tax=Ammonifex thiophilus TaxID=444093 RepID=A0A3D8P3M4_9THEO|nr:TadE/TadG family type IV pilus assembly protein [Ammonifex thiophilus]RDV82343.1 hypothetical protein DXX99_07990 [Ammonifex thiophilus]
MLRGECGFTQAASFALLLPLFLVLFCLGVLWLHLATVKSSLDMAAREGARVYGIRLGQGDEQCARWEAEAAARRVLEGTKLLPPGFSWGKPPAGQRGAEVNFSDDRTWARCTVRLYLPNPLAVRVPKVLSFGRESSAPSWWPEHFTLTATGAAKHEPKEPPRN